MNLHVSTKMEQAWFVDPDLLAAEGEEERPRRVEIDADSPPPPDATMSLGDADLEELSAGQRGDETDGRSRHYLDVSLKGAIKAADDTIPNHSVGVRLKGAIDQALAVLSRPRPAPGIGLPPVGPVRARQVVAHLADVIVGVFEPGRVTPARLASVSFLFGVGMTLVGVMLAL